MNLCFSRERFFVRDRVIRREENRGYDNFYAIVEIVNISLIEGLKLVKAGKMHKCVDSSDNNERTLEMLRVSPDFDDVVTKNCINMT